MIETSLHLISVGFAFCGKNSAMKTKMLVFVLMITAISHNLLTVETVKLKYMNEVKELLFKKDDTKHPCARECIKGETMTCAFKFLVEGSTSMDVTCRDCPYNISDCSLPGCVPGGGLQRPIITINRIAPGPDILACEGDSIIVDVTNTLKTEGITIHWHGLHQVNTPFMDGTPFITQCPILPFNTFRYQFNASPHGTHMWHGHSGFQDCDGLYGKLIIRREEEKSFRELYDYDLPEHSLIIWHWYDWTSQGILEKVLHINGTMDGFGLLINGKGVLKEFEDKDQPDLKFTTPREIFSVTKGKRYLFRSVINSAIYCPVQLSIDNHSLTIVSTSTSNVEPFTVESLMLNAGERFNFIVSADQAEDCYWMRFRAMGDCGEDKTSVHQEAYLCYNNIVPKSSNDKPSYDDAKRTGKLFNAVEVAATNYENNSLIFLTELRSTEPNEINVNGTPAATLYLQLDARIYNEALYPGAWPQFNNITFDFPSKPMYPQKEELTEEDTCNKVTALERCTGRFCSCPYTHELPLNALVEVVLVDISLGRKQDHPIHMHGNNFYVVALEPVGKNISFQDVKNLNERGEIKKVLNGLPTKDTVSVPNKGYAVIRFITSNPGYWLFHCHVSNHMELGMAMVLKVGNHGDMVKTPKDFPRCGNWIYEPEKRGNNSDTSIHHFQWLSIICIIVFTIKLV